jgi:hypothetical protein
MKAAASALCQRALGFSAIKSGGKKSARAKYRRWYASHQKSSETAIDLPLEFALISAQIPDLVIITIPPTREAAVKVGFGVCGLLRNPLQSTHSFARNSIRVRYLAVLVSSAMCIVGPGRTAGIASA